MSAHAIAKIAQCFCLLVCQHEGAEAVYGPMQLIDGNTLAAAVGGLHIARSKDYDIVTYIGEHARFRTEWDR